MIKYKTLLNIQNNNPLIEILVLFQDNLFEENLVLKNIINEYGTEKIEFEINKNDNVIGNIFLVNKDYDSFFKEMYSILKDIDFENSLKLIKENIVKDLIPFFKYYTENVIDKAITLEGVKKKNKLLSGIEKNRLFIEK